VVGITTVASVTRAKKVRFMVLCGFGKEVVLIPFQYRQLGARSPESDGSFKIVTIGLTILSGKCPHAVEKAEWYFAQ
jgi:hypothetical protein